MGTNRRQRRKSKKKQRQEQSRPESFVDNMKGMSEEEGGGGGKTTSKKDNEEGKGGGGGGDGIMSGASISDAQAAYDEKPDVSRIVVDEETGIERIQQGKNVMDVLTGKKVKLSDLGPQYRLAQMFPGVPPEIRSKHRFDIAKITVPEMVERFQTAASMQSADGKTILPPHPQVTDEALDFVLANRDWLGPKMKRTLGRLKLRSQSLGNKEDALQLRALWKHYLTIENHVSAPFRQMLLEAENKIGMNFGNLDMKTYCSGEIYERTACYLILKSMVGHWEKKVRDAEYVENIDATDENFIEILSVGDPKRYLPNPPIIYRYNECVRITLMAQNMTATFVNTKELFDDLPPEVRFVEKASFVKGGTSLRKYMVDEFCPQEEIEPSALREGLRRLYVQLENMQIDPYGDLTNIVGRLCLALEVGTDDATDPYRDWLGNLDPNGPGYFQTYTFNHNKKSLVKFLDSAINIDVKQGGAGIDTPLDSVLDQLSNEAENLFSFNKDNDNENIREVPLTEAKDDEDYVYEVPNERACNRPHDMGWLDLLQKEEDFGLGKPKKENEEEDSFEADNWREVETEAAV